MGHGVTFWELDGSKMPSIPIWEVSRGTNRPREVFLRELDGSKMGRGGAFGELDGSKMGRGAVFWELDGSKVPSIPIVEVFLRELDGTNRPREVFLKIGRASCRERVWIAVWGVA